MRNSVCLAQNQKRIDTMSHRSLPRWSKITREERFFTCMLFSDVVKYPSPLWRLLAYQLGYDNDVQVIDQGYEVCLFRDAAREELGLVERHRELEKVTFDLLLTLSNKAVVIIEAKAHQSFTSNQIVMLHRSKRVLQASSSWPAKEIRIVGLCSSRYSPRTRTREQFDALITWQQVAEAYTRNQDVYLRADSIYRN